MKYLIGLVFFLLNLADGLMTLISVHLLGSEIECNPIMRGLMNSIGDWWLIPKILLGFLFLLIIIRHWNFLWLRIVVVCMVLIYLGVVSYHLWYFPEILRLTNAIGV